jgi:hypothetical protein
MDHSFRKDANMSLSDTASAAGAFHAKRHFAVICDMTEPAPPDTSW